MGDRRAAVLAFCAVAGCGLLGGPPDEDGARALIVPLFEQRAAEEATCAQTQSGGTGPMTFGIKEKVLQRCLAKAGYVEVVSPYAENEGQFARYRITEKGTAAGLGAGGGCVVPMAVPRFGGVTRLEPVDEQTIDVVYRWEFGARTDIEVVQCFRHPGLENRGRINGRADDIGVPREGRAVLERGDRAWTVKSLRL